MAFSEDDMRRLHGWLEQRDDHAIEQWFTELPIMFPDTEANDVIDSVTPLSAMLMKRLGLRTTHGELTYLSVQPRVEDQILELGQCLLNELTRRYLTSDPRAGTPLRDPGANEASTASQA
ncbi:MAG TPA: hypothetical protein VFQ54_02780 [Thermomicrobiales bacterium]|nr:hypothetical protein [Thermomicrobiales bacterium]